MSYDYKTELILPQGLRVECIKLFKECKEFDTPGDLRVFARVTQLTLVVDCIPTKEALNHNELILNLLKTRDKTSSEPALLHLLDALAVEYQQEFKGGQFKELKEEIKSAFRQGEHRDQEKDYLQLVEERVSSEGQGADKLAERWIEEAGDNLDELALRITLAVFNGTAFEVIESAKDELLTMLEELVPPPPAPDPENPPPIVPHVPLMRRLAKAGARETEGKPPDWQRVVELEPPNLAGEALVYAWQLHRETAWRWTLIEWLTKHAAGRHAADIRTRAAVAVGRLAVKDYRFVRDKLLSDWARKKDPQFRTAVGMALGVLVREENLAEEVQGLLREWCESDEKAKRWAAMRAYIYVGPYCRPAGEPVACWRELAASEHVAIDIPISETEVVRLNNPLHMSLMDAMVKFFFNAAYLPEAEKRPCFAGILGELKEWVSSSDENAWLGLFLFTTLGQLSVGADGETDGAPLLLQLLGEGPGVDEEEAGYRTQLAGVFEVALRNGNTIAEARELLCAWLGWANGLKGEPNPYKARIQTLFKEIIAADGGGRARGKLAACLRECGRNQTAQRLLAGL